MTNLQPIGQYRLEAQITSGRYADAYRAVDTVRKRTVTLQVLKTGQIPDGGAFQRFLQRAQAAADLVHPRLAWVWETGEADGAWYVAERHISGPTLRQRLAENGPLSWGEASQAIEQLAQGLDFTHSRGYIHGAVQPENIYLSAEQGAVLAGFGVPSPLPPLPTGEGPGVRGEGPGVRGDRSELYLAPEIWLGAQPSPASDRYALACVWVEMLTGRPLFAGGDIADIRQKHLSELCLPDGWPDGVPWQIEPVLERALAKSPAERFASAAEMAAAPAQLAGLALDEGERRRRDDLRKQRLEAGEQARRQAEEAARMAALEQARRELADQMQRQGAPLAAMPVMSGPAADVSAPEIPEIPVWESREPAARSAIPGTRRASRRRFTSAAAKTGRKLRWPVWLGGAIILLGLVWGWNRGWFIPGVAPTATPSVTMTSTPAQPAIMPTIPTVTTAPSFTPSPSITPTPSPSATPTATPTRKPTATLSLTPSPTATVKPTFFVTRTPKEKPDNNVPRSKKTSSP